MGVVRHHIYLKNGQIDWDEEYKAVSEGRSPPLYEQGQWVTQDRLTVEAAMEWRAEREASEGPRSLPKPRG